MRNIPLTRGQFAIVDDADYEWLNQWKWQAAWNRCISGFYARRTFMASGRNQCVYMHRAILGLEAGDPIQGDHRNQNTLDNTRGNLRKATRLQNNHNTRMKKGNTTGYKGVSYRPDKRKYVARIRLNRRYIHLGQFTTAEAAHLAYVEASAIYHGEFARTA